MKCPTCDVDLVMSERQGIEIDYCPKCRGIWLDRGELDKIIEKASADEAPPVQAAPPPQQAAPAPQPQYAPPPQPAYAPPPPQYGHSYGHGHHPYKKRKHWLEEIFD